MRVDLTTAIQVHPDRKPAGAISARAVVIGLLLSVALSLVIPYIDVFLSDTFLGSCHLPPGAVFVLLVLVLVVNPLLRLMHRRWPLNRVELLLIYCMLLFSTLVPGHGAENVFIPVVITPYYYATAENNWEQLFFEHIPEWFAPSDPPVVAAFYEGLRPGALMPWRDWYVPLAAWGLFTLLLYGLVLFLSALFRRQWSDREKLAFPLVALPIEMTRETVHPLRPGAFLGKRVMWIGFATAALLQFQNGMRFYYPGFPGFKLEVSFAELLREEPWRSMGGVSGDIWLAVIGVSVLLRTEVSVSLWLFFWFSKFERLVAHLVGVRGQGPRTAWGEPLWLGGQPVGGYVAYVALAFYSARGHLRDVLRAAVSGQGNGGEREAFSYRACVVGALVCLAALVTWCMTAGMSLWVALAQMLIYIVLAMALTKVVAESGLLFVQATFSSLETMVSFVGTEGIGARSLTVGMFIERSFMTDLRAFLMPSFQQSLKIADLALMDRAKLVLWCSVTVLLSTVICYWANLMIVYSYGGLACNPWFVQGAGPGGFRLLANYLAAPRPPSPTGIISVLAGGAFTLWLYFMRQRFLWFPLHPIGFIMMQTYPMRRLWFSIFLGWAAKSVIMRYGGPRGLTVMIPLFLGVAFGDIFMMVVWLIVDAVTGTHGHYLMPG
jgi:hypothetical protein